MTNQQLTVNAIRILSADAVQKAKSGHPGLPMGMAPSAYALWGENMKFDPSCDKWDDRDRFVLSGGHGSMLIYSLLHLFGFGLTIEDLRQFRQLGSLTPGHPEYAHTRGVETTTGPLGQGIANAVGMAMAEKHLADRFNRPGYPVVDHNTYCFLGDGDMMEGISHEACSLAGTLNLSRLIALYDDNGISIEGDTDIAFRENVPERFRAYGWNVIEVPDANEWQRVDEAIKVARHSDRPTLIVCHTTIGFGSPLAGSAACHGSPLGEENLAHTRKTLEWPLEEPFAVPAAVYETTAKAIERGKAAHKAWDELMAAYEKEYPELAAEYRSWMNGDALKGLAEDDSLYAFDKPVSTRSSSGTVLNRICERVPNLFGGSADLAPSNVSYMKGRGDFSPETPEGSNLHFGVREHAMSAICNGIRLHGGLIPYCATFFVFSDYMKNAMRMSAIMGLPIPYILSHDSIGVGEDGPTHQPVEHLAGLRAMPGLTVFRPADAKESAAAWVCALTGDSPVALVLTRQNLPVYENSGRDALKGGYVLARENGDKPDVILIASGSEVEPCMGAREILEKEGIHARVVSMPSFELFEKQDPAYRESVLPNSVRARVAVEAASPFGWERYTGLDGAIIAMPGFGASGPAKQLFERYGFTSQNVADMAKGLLR